VLGGWVIPKSFFKYCFNYFGVRREQVLLYFYLINCSLFYFPFSCFVDHFSFDRSVAYTTKNSRFLDGFKSFRNGKKSSRTKSIKSSRKIGRKFRL
jgi:hypothetical protein